MRHFILGEVSSDALLDFAALVAGILVMTVLFAIFLRASTLWIAKIKLPFGIATRISFLTMVSDTLPRMLIQGAIKPSPAVSLAVSLLTLFLAFCVACLLSGTMIKYPQRPSTQAAATGGEPGILNYQSPQCPEGPIGQPKGALIALTSFAMLIVLIAVFFVVVIMASGRR